MQKVYTVFHRIFSKPEPVPEPAEELEHGLALEEKVKILKEHSSVGAFLKLLAGLLYEVSVSTGSKSLGKYRLSKSVSIYGYEWYWLCDTDGNDMLSVGARVDIEFAVNNYSLYSTNLPQLMEAYMALKDLKARQDAEARLAIAEKERLKTEYLAEVTKQKEMLPIDEIVRENADGGERNG